MTDLWKPVAGKRARLRDGTVTGVITSNYSKIYPFSAEYKIQNETKILTWSPTGSFWVDPASEHYWDMIAEYMEQNTVNASKYRSGDRVRLKEMTILWAKGSIVATAELGSFNCDLIEFHTQAPFKTGDKVIVCTIEKFTKATIQSELVNDYVLLLCENAVKPIVEHIGNLQRI